MYYLCSICRIPKLFTFFFPGWLFFKKIRSFSYPLELHKTFFKKLCSPFLNPIPSYSSCQRFGKGLFIFLHHVQEKYGRGRATASVCWQGAHRHFPACSESCITEGSVQHLQELSTSSWLAKKERRDALFVPVPRALVYTAPLYCTGPSCPAA